MFLVGWEFRSTFTPVRHMLLLIVFQPCRWMKLRSISGTKRLSTRRQTRLIQHNHPLLVKMDMDVDDFAGLMDEHRAKAIAKRDNSDRKKMACLQIALEHKQKKEADRLAKLEEKEKEK